MKTARPVFYAAAAGIKGFPRKASFLENIFRILTDCGNIPPDTGELFRAFKGPEAARHLLFDFHHAHISFRRVVVERHPEIVHEGEGLTVSVA